MNMKKQDSSDDKEIEYAFPIPGIGVTGMTLRDYFAAKALEGVLSNCQGVIDGSEVQTAFEIADAMMEERGK